MNPRAAQFGAGLGREPNQPTERRPCHLDKLTTENSDESRETGAAFGQKMPVLDQICRKYCALDLGLVAEAILKIDAWLAEALLPE